MYVRMKTRACERVGIGSIGIEISDDTNTEKVLEAITGSTGTQTSAASSSSLPLPKQIDTDRIIAAVSAGKGRGRVPPYKPWPFDERQTPFCSLYT